MRRHDAYARVIRSTVIVFAIGFAWSSFALAEEPTSSPAPAEQSVQERAVPPVVEGEPASPPEAGDVQKRALPQKGTTGPLPVFGGTFEPDYRYPWVVRIDSGCGGVLLDPQWVLTAAHCVTPGGASDVRYERTDPYTGAVQTETRAPANNIGNRGVFTHPDYALSPAVNDIALIKLAQPFTSNRYIQTVGLPRNGRQAGVVGTVASISHRVQLPAGRVAVLRTPIPYQNFAAEFSIYASSASATLCPGDSGSGFVTVENGRATVRGIASTSSIIGCMGPTPSGDATFTDVFTVTDWILQTINGNSNMGTSFAGNTSVRWIGRSARGWMRVSCVNPHGEQLGPLNVIGVEERAFCQPGQARDVVCRLDQNQGPLASAIDRPKITGFTKRTTMANGASEVRSLLFSNNNAAYISHSEPSNVTLEFMCVIGPPEIGASTQ